MEPYVSMGAIIVIFFTKSGAKTMEISPNIGLPASTILVLNAV